MRGVTARRHVFYPIDLRFIDLPIRAPPMKRLTSEFRHRSRFFFHPSLRVASRNARHHLHHRPPRRHRNYHLYRDSSKRTVSNLSLAESIDQFHESLSPLSPYIHDFPANLRSTKSLRRICRVTSSGSTTLHEP